MSATGVVGEANDVYFVWHNKTRFITYFDYINMSSLIATVLSIDSFAVRSSKTCVLFTCTPYSRTAEFRPNVVVLLNAVVTNDNATARRPHGLLVANELIMWKFRRPPPRVAVGRGARSVERMSPWYPDAKYRMNLSRSDISAPENRGKDRPPANPDRRVSNDNNNNNIIVRATTARRRCSADERCTRLMRSWYERGASRTRWRPVAGADRGRGGRGDGYGREPPTVRHPYRRHRSVGRRAPSATATRRPNGRRQNGRRTRTNALRARRARRRRRCCGRDRPTRVSVRL